VSEREPLDWGGTEAAARGRAKLGQIESECEHWRGGPVEFVL